MNIKNFELSNLPNLFSKSNEGTFTEIMKDLATALLYKFKFEGFDIVISDDSNKAIMKVRNVGSITALSDID